MFQKTLSPAQVILVPLLYGFNLALIYFDYQTSPLLLSPPKLPLPFIGLSLLFSIIGLLLWLSSYFYLGTSFSIIPRARKIVTRGPYRFFSHPIYLGIILTMIGLSIAVASLKGLFYALFICLPLSLWRARNEEKLLKKKFGQRYEAYKKSTFF